MGSWAVPETVPRRLWARDGSVDCHPACRLSSTLKSLRRLMPGTSGTGEGAARPLQTWIDRLAFEGEDAEGALMHAPQRLAAHETLQRLHAQRELAQRQASFAAKTARTQPLQV